MPISRPSLTRFRLAHDGGWARRALALCRVLVLLVAAWALSAPARAQQAPVPQVLLRDDFSAPFSGQQGLDPARWTAYDSTYAYGRTQFGLQPSVASEGATSFARLGVRNYSGNASFPFRGTEISSTTFELGTGKEMEARVRVTDLPSGLIGAFWAYGSRGTFGTSSFRSDEIDIEFLTKQSRSSLLLTNWNDWDPSNPTYEDGIHHAGVTTSVAGLDWSGWNVYKIRWLPDRTEWFVNGALIQSLAPAHPDQPLAVRFNAWAPDASFQAAYDPALAPASSEGAAQTYSLDVDWVEVRTVVPTLSLSLSPASWSEGAGSQVSTATVHRSSGLSAPLTLQLASGNASVSVPAQVTMAAGAATATFPVAAIDDQIVQGARDISITASAGGFVSGVASALVRDDDVAGLVLNSALSLRTSEAGGRASFTVRLSSQPVAEVRLDLSSSRPSEGLPASPLIFTPQNWSVPQAVTVAGQDDFSQDGDQTYQLAMSTANSTDGVYKQLGVGVVPVVNVDNDVASILVAAAPNLQTSEAGRNATFSIQLASQPSAPVTIRLESSLPSEARTAPSSLTFSALDWSTPQAVTIIGMDDDIADGSRPYQITTLPATSADPLYNGLDALDVSLSNVDDEIAGFLIAPTGGLETDEAGRMATFSVRLSSRPLAEVTLPLSASSGEGTVSPASLTFSAANWTVPQPVTVTGADDAVDDGDRPYAIVTGAPLGDAGYKALSGESVPDVPVLNRDNDAVGLAITPSSGLVPLVTSEGGQNAELSVVLQSQPTSDVVLSFASGAPGEGIVAPGAVVFTPSNWSLAQKVTLVGVDDAVADGDQSYAIAASISSADAGYQVLAPPGIAATNRDNDIAALTLSLSALSFSEAAGAQAAVGTITRNTLIGAPLTVTLSSSEVGAATVPATVTIASGSASATFPISAVDDGAVDGAQSSAIRAEAPGLAPATALVTVSDDDVAPPPAPTATPTPTPSPTPVPTPDPTPIPTPDPALSLSLTQSAVDENAMSQTDRPAARGRIERSAASANSLANPLLVRLSSSDTSELRVPATVLIPAGQSRAEFVLTPVDDAVADGARQVLVAASAEGYLSRPSSTILVRDDEAPTLSVSLAWARVAENGASIVTIRRNSEVTALTPALRVALSLSPLGRATLPALVLIPARASSVSLQLRGIDNALADGPRRVTITARALALGWRAGSATLTLTDNEPGSRLSLSGRVTTASAVGVPGGLPVAGVTLSLLSGLSGTTVLDSTVSASDGSYVFRGLAGGSYRVLAAREGAAFAPSTRAATLRAGLGASSVGGLDFVATLRGQISGSVRRLNADGTLSSLPGVTVRARAGALSLSVRTDSSGSFRFDGLPLGLFEVAPLSGALPGAAFSPLSRAVRIGTSNTVASGLAFITSAASAASAASARSLDSDSLAPAEDNGAGTRGAGVQPSLLVLSWAQAQAAQGTIMLRFSGPLDAASAQDVAGYGVQVNGVACQVEYARCPAGTVTLILAGAVQAGDRIECRWHGLLDSAERALAGRAALVAR